MLVKTYYSTGHFDVFDTATLTDSSLFMGNVLTDYALEVADARSGRALWLDLFYYEAADDGCCDPCEASGYTEGAYERVATMQCRAVLADDEEDDQEGVRDEKRLRIVKVVFRWM